MLEQIVVWIVVALALAFVGRLLYRRLTGRSGNCCDSECGACPTSKECTTKRSKGDTS
jgi:hypothetical protein